MFDFVVEGLGELLEAAKEVPTEKIAAVGLVVLGALTILKGQGQQGDGSGS